MKFAVPSVFACLLFPSVTHAILLNETEPNNNIADAQNLPLERFSLEFNQDVEDSTTIPWISIAGTGDGTFDFYSFSVTSEGATMSIFDTDDTTFDTELFLYDSAGVLIGHNDDNAHNEHPVDPGSDGVSFTLDSMIQYTFDSCGTYFVVVGKWPSSDPEENNDCLCERDPTNGPVGLTPQYGDYYTLHISLSSAFSDACPASDGKGKGKGKGSASRSDAARSNGKGSSGSNSARRRARHVRG